MSLNQTCLVLANVAIFFLVAFAVLLYGIPAALHLDKMIPGFGLAIMAALFVAVMHQAQLHRASACTEKERDE